MSAPARGSIRLLPAVSLVVASMVGTGVFTSLGYQVRDLPSGPAIVLLWVLGGVLALCGALSYAELASALPRSGGEYHYLSRLFHPSLGWAAGVISVVIGFAAPAALAALALGGYAARAWPVLPPQGVAVAALAAVTAGHLVSVRSSGWLQSASTALKLLLIVGFIVAAFVLPGAGDIRWRVEPRTDLALIWRPAFGIALLFVFYAYSGWNAAVYIVEEIHDTRRTVVRALMSGTVVVMLLYLLLNTAFLKAAPVGRLAGVTEVGHIAAETVFGTGAARWFSGVLSVGLVATLSAMVWAGPRVLESIGRDLPAFGYFGVRNRRGVPARATLLQSSIALGLVLVGDFERLLTYSQTGLTLSALLTVAGLFRLRWRGDAGVFRCPWFPLPPLIFLAMTGFVIIRSLAAEPVPTIAGLATFAGAWLLYFPCRAAGS